ncbi:MAG: hypothetical protein ACOX8S_05970 [Christensenellales bacterium]
MSHSSSPACKNIVKAIEKDIFVASGCAITGLRLLRAKDGIHVFKGSLDGQRCVFKYFETTEHRREIENYRILQRLKVPTIKTFALGEKSIAMEDIDFSHEWRLGIPEDMQNISVAKALANWYFMLHERGANAPELDCLYCEYDDVNEEGVESLCQKLPQSAETFGYIQGNFVRLRQIIDSPDLTLVYNDFYWTNLAARKDGQSAMMFDYNLLGKGYRYGDIRNVQSSLCKNAAAAFKAEYDRLYMGRHRSSRSASEMLEKRVDDVASCIFTLICAYKKESFPSWAEKSRQQALNGELLLNAKKLLTDQLA